MKKPVYDVFIAHAYEDQNAFPSELAVALKEKGLRVWYSGLEVKAGESIAANVALALKQIRSGVLIISPAFFKKRWMIRELQVVFALQKDRKRILPVLHRVTLRQVRQELPVLSSRYVITSKKNMVTIVNRVLRLPGGKVQAKKLLIAGAPPRTGSITLGGIVPLKATLPGKRKPKTGTQSSE